MSWSANIKSDRNITQEEMQKIIDEMPDSISRISVFGKRNQLNGWGWSAGADIDIPIGNMVIIGGAYEVSEHLAEDTAKYIAGRLKENGHTVSIEYDL